MIYHDTFCANSAGFSTISPGLEALVSQVFIRIKFPSFLLVHITGRADPVRRLLEHLKNVRSGAKNIPSVKPKVRDPRSDNRWQLLENPSCANFLALPNHVWILHDHHASALSRTGFGGQNRGLSPLSSKLGLSSSPANNETLGYQSFFHTMKSFIDKCQI